MNAAYLNLLAQAGAAGMTHVAILNGTGTQIGARQAVGWAVTGGVTRLDGDYPYPVTAGTVVASWEGYSAATGGTNYGPVPLTGGSVTFANDGTFTLEAAGTAVDHAAAP